MTVAILIENLQALPNKELPVMVYDEMFSAWMHVVLAAPETVATDNGETQIIQLLTNEKDI